MDNYSSYTDINSLLSTAKSQLTDIEKTYNASLYQQVIPDELLIKVKDYLGNLRSALDYLNTRIPGHGKYFPICNSANDFQNSVTGVNPALKSKLETYQPYNGNNWLKYFNILNNKNKHLTLVPQKRSEVHETEVSNGSGAVSWTTGVTFCGDVRAMGVSIDPNTQLPVPNNLVKTTKTIWVSFIFDNSVSTELPDDINALGFLTDLFDNVRNLVHDIEKSTT